ncbi:MAG: sugar phosphate nucleotidyltransferase [bacterium]
MNTQAVILAGGKGTRLSVLYPDHPKALVPIAGKPFIEHLVELLYRQGITDVHIAAGHLAGTLMKWVEDYAPKPGGLTITVEPQPLGTAGGLKFVEKYLRTDPFFVLNGDSLVPNLRFADMAKQHRASNAMATLAVTRIDEAGRYGTVEFDGSDTITMFLEKADRKGGWVNGGVYLMSRATLAQIVPGRNLSIETDLFPALAQLGRLRAFRAEPPLLDMGTPEGLAAMERFLTSSQ